MPDVTVTVAAIDGSATATASYEVTTGGQVLNALAQPSAFGWPDATNTGVPAGTALSPSGYITVDVPGAIVQDLDVAGGITVKAPNVTIRRCKVHRSPTPGFGCIRLQGDASGLLVEDCELWYEDSADPGAVIGGNGYTLRRCNVHDVTEGPRLGSNTVVEDCIIHHARRITGGHIDLLQTTGGSSIQVRHNTLLAYNPDLDDPFNSAYICKSDSGPIDDVWFENNLVNGGNYTLYFVQAHHPIGPVTVLGNRWGRDFREGPASVQGVTGLTWDASNVWDDTNMPVG